MRNPPTPASENIVRNQTKQQQAKHKLQIQSSNSTENVNFSIYKIIFLLQLTVQNGCPHCQYAVLKNKFGNVSVSRECPGCSPILYRQCLDYIECLQHLFLVFDVLFANLPNFLNEPRTAIKSCRCIFFLQSTF